LTSEVMNSIMTSVDRIGIEVTTSRPSIEKAVAAARAQKLLILSIVLNLLAFAILQGKTVVHLPFSLLPNSGNEVVLYAALTLFQSVCIYRVATAIGTSGILYAILVWVPALGVLVIIHLNGLTNRFLKAAGFRVGLFGVRAEDLPT
jgi:hypothetical protein